MKLLTLVSLILLTACDDFFNNPSKAGQSNSDQKLETISIDGELSTNQVDWVFAENSVYFDVQDFSQVDSVIFKGSLRSQKQSVRCFAELYNLTDGEPIVGSLLQSRIRYQLHSVRSGNIRSSFPYRSISLGVRIRSEIDLNYVEARNFLVLVYYH